MNINSRVRDATTNEISIGTCRVYDRSASGAVRPDFVRHQDGFQCFFLSVEFFALDGRMPLFGGVYE